MLFVIQFPVGDFRQFASRAISDNLLGRPAWPAVIADDDFVRAFGSVRERPRGGINNWIGEHVICDARRALRFLDLNSFECGDSTIHVRGGFRRFYFDGEAVGKYEVGIEFDFSDTFSIAGDNAEQLVSHLLNLKVKIPSPLAEPMQVRLADAGEPLAQLYSLSSVETSSDPEKLQGWVEAGKPVTAIVRKAESERLALPFQKKDLPRIDDYNLTYFRIPVNGKTLGLWEFCLDEVRSPKDPLGQAREMRITLLRLHAERMCFLLALQKVRSGAVSFDRGSPESERFQRYLLESLRRIRRDRQAAHALSNSDVIETVKDLEDTVTPGYRDQILQAVRQLGIRGNIERKVREYVEQGTVVYNYYNSTHNHAMGDQLNTGDIIGSVFNYKSTMNKTEQNVDGVTVVQGVEREHLKALVAELNNELEAVAKKDPDAAQEVADAADRVIIEASREKPNRTFLEASADGLKEAAQAVAAIAPTVIAVATQIAKAVVGT